MHLHYFGLPCPKSSGKVFAKVLREEWTHVEPSGAYWNPVRIVSDNRIPVDASDTTTFGFKAGTGQPATIKAELYFRRAFRELMEQKGWTDPDILMTVSSVTLQASFPSVKRNQAK